jgi:hypothetical protein
MLGEGAVVSLVGEFVVEWFLDRRAGERVLVLARSLAHDVALWSVVRLSLTVGQFKNP